MKTTLLLLIAMLSVAITAQAQPPGFAPRGQIKYLAHELAEAAHYAHQNAEACADFRRSTRVLETLQRLDWQARRLNRKLRRHHRYPYRTEQAYWDLVHTYRRAKRQLRRSHTAEVVRQDMRRVGRLLDRMAYFYDGYGYYGRYDRYDDDHYRYNDHYRGGDYDHGYYGKKGKRRSVKPPRKSTPQY